MIIRSFIEADQPWADALISVHFGSTRIVSRGVLHDAQHLPGLVALEGGAPVGLLLYQIVQKDCEIVVLIAVEPRRGVGAALLKAAGQVAQQAACRRLWLVTTNDNQGAQAFYHAQGLRQVAVHRGAVTAARALKPEIPLLGENGIPIEDEIEYEIILEDT